MKQVIFGRQGSAGRGEGVALPRLDSLTVGEARAMVVVFFSRQLKHVAKRRPTLGAHTDDGALHLCAGHQCRGGFGYFRARVFLWSDRYEEVEAHGRKTHARCVSKLWGAAPPRQPRRSASPAPQTQCAGTASHCSALPAMTTSKNRWLRQRAKRRHRSRRWVQVAPQLARCRLSRRDSSTWTDSSTAGALQPSCKSMAARDEAVEVKNTCGISHWRGGR